jgi:hypothetical protein
MSQGWTVFRAGLVFVLEKFDPKIDCTVFLQVKWPNVCESEQVIGGAAKEEEEKKRQTT